jgi:hypothetical protein
MNVDCAIESRWTTTSHAILAQRHGCSLLYLLISSKVGKIVARQIEHFLGFPGVMCGQGHLWTGRSSPNDSRDSQQLLLLGDRKRYAKWLWVKLFYQIINLLQDAMIQSAGWVMIREVPCSTYLSCQLDKVGPTASTSCSTLQNSPNRKDD